MRLLCQKGVCKSYLYGPPSFPGQWLLGNANPAPVPCLVGTVTVGIGNPIGSNPGHGSSGPEQKPQEQPPPAGGQCTNGAIPFRTDGAPVGRDLKPDIQNSLNNFCNICGDAWQVTEGCPASPVHTNDCHANCTCVDVALKNRTYTPESVGNMLNCGKSNGARLVFETNDPNLYNTLIGSGFSSRDVKLFPLCSTGKRPCANGSHFSYYCPTCR